MVVVGIGNVSAHDTIDVVARASSAMAVTKATNGSVCVCVVQ